jgi:hypothetical protein
LEPHCSVSIAIVLQTSYAWPGKTCRCASSGPLLRLRLESLEDTAAIPEVPLKGALLRRFSWN